MLFRCVTALAVLCTVGTYCFRAHADGFWDFQTLGDFEKGLAPAATAPRNELPQYDAPQYDAPTYAPPAYNPPVNHPPVYGAPVYGAPVYGAPVYDATVYQAPAYITPATNGSQYVHPVYDRPAYAAPTAAPQSAVFPSATSPVDLWTENAPMAVDYRLADLSACEPMPPAPTSLTYAPQDALPPSPPAPAMPERVDVARTYAAVPAPLAPPPPLPPPAPNVPETGPTHGDATAALNGQALADAFYGVGTCSANPMGAAVFQPFVRDCTWGPPVARKLGRFYGGLEYLHWWTRGQRLPVLVTSSPAGTPDFEAGVWGYAATQVLYGGDRTAADDNSGGRFCLGINLDCEGCDQVEAEYFLLDSSNFNFAITSPDDYPIIARPFYNTFLGQEDSELVGYPGIVDGSVSVRGTANFDGLGIWLRHNLLNFQPQCVPGACGPTPSGPWRSCDGTGCGCASRRLDLIMGYRRLDLDENLYINEHLTSTDPGGPIALGTTLDIQDRFHTENEFHGSDFGLDWKWSKGCWGVDALFKCAIGNVRQRVCVNGWTTVTPPAGAPADNDGGVLALESNSGNSERDEFTVIPEVGLDAFYQWNCHVRLKVGYTLIYFTNVLRPGDLIDTNVDSQQLPPALITNGRFPELKFYEDDFWAQGLRLGAEFTF